MMGWHIQKKTSLNLSLKLLMYNGQNINVGKCP